MAISEGVRERAALLVEAIDAGAPFEEVGRELRTIRLDRLDPPVVAALARALASVDAAGTPLKVAYLCNVTVSELLPHVTLWAAREGLVVEQWVAPFGQHQQQVMDRSSPLRRFDPDIVVIILEPRLLRPEAFNRFAALPPEDRRSLADDLLAELGTVIEQVTRDLGAIALVGNAVPPARPGAGVADTTLPLGETEFFDRLNLELLGALKDDPRAQHLDLRARMASVGTDGTDSRRYYLAKMPWTGPALPAIAEEVARHLVAATGAAKKCMVVDLDNTLWGGIIGEDGVDGIRIGPGDPVGEAYLDVQRCLLDLRQRGVLLAISSKNNEADVREAFAKPSMLLSLDDFVAAEIHWRPKHESLRAIARGLNIGEDSLVFVDDNPAEVAVVNEALPDVRTVLLDGDPASFPDRLSELMMFEKSRVLEDDLAKTAQYRQQTERKRHREGMGDLQDYLGSLETVVRIRPAAEADLPRLRQLFTKTNQFNLTTKRYPLVELEQQLGRDDRRVILWEMEDRFGRLGTVGAYITRIAGRVVEIDSFLMSCRAMGRQAETAVMNHLKEEFLSDARSERLLASYVPTRKNVPVAEFFEEQGLRIRGADRPGVDDTVPDGTVWYELARDEVKLLPCPWIRVEEGAVA